MKFYYNGQLIRTSKTHHYTHACVEISEKGIRCIGCSSTKQGAERVKAEKVARIAKWRHPLSEADQKTADRIMGWQIVEIEERA